MNDDDVFNYGKNGRNIDDDDGRKEDDDDVFNYGKNGKDRKRLPIVPCVL